MEAPAGRPALPSVLPTGCLPCPPPGAGAESRHDSFPAPEGRGGPRGSPPLLVLALLSITAGAGALRAGESAATGGARSPRRSLTSARGGLDLIFSSAVVTDELEVTVEPVSTEPRAVLDEILAPLSLAARAGRAARSYRQAAIAAIAAITAIAALAALAARARGPPGVRGGDPRHAGEAVHRARGAGRPALGVADADAVLVPSIGGDVSRVVELLPGVAASDHSAAFHVRGSRSATSPSSSTASSSTSRSTWRASRARSASSTAPSSRASTSMAAP